MFRIHTRDAPLVPVATLRTRRSGVLVRERGRPVAEVVLDSVAVLDGRKIKRRFREVEIELVGSGDDEVLGRIAARLRQSGATPSEETPKVLPGARVDLPSRTGNRGHRQPRSNTSWP